MPLITVRRSLAAGESVANILAGSQYEFLPVDAFVEFGLTASATGVMASVTSGTDILMQDQEISNANRMPVYPDDFLLSDIAAAGERLVVAVRNTGAAAATLFAAVKITPV